MDRPQSWTQLAKCSLFGVGMTWLCFAIGSAVNVVTGSSADVAQAMYPAAMLIGLIAALLLFWPLITLVARIGTIVATRLPWTSNWGIWAVVGALLGALTLSGFLTLLSGGAADFKEILPMGAGLGAISAGVTHWRLRASSSRDCVDT